MRKIPCSTATTEMLKRKGLKRFDVFGFFPVDRYDCECQPIIKETIKKLALLNEVHRAELRKQIGHIACPKDKTGKNKYQVICANCKETIGYCYASDESLKDWFDFHYVTWTDGEYWYGCYTPHISPISLQLCFECTCGQDTRDFRANMRMEGKTVDTIEQANSVGRLFSQKDSKFIVKKC